MTFAQYCTYNVFGRWEESGVSRENLCRHKENIWSTWDNNPSPGSKQRPWSDDTLSYIKQCKSWTCGSIELQSLLTHWEKGVHWHFIRSDFPSWVISQKSKVVLQVHCTPHLIHKTLLSFTVAGVCIEPDHDLNMAYFFIYSFLPLFLDVLYIHTYIDDQVYEFIGHQMKQQTNCNNSCKE